MKKANFFLILALGICFCSCKKDVAVNPSPGSDKQNELMKFLHYLDKLPTSQREAELTAYLKKEDNKILPNFKEKDITARTGELDDPSDEEISNWAYLPSNAAFENSDPNGDATIVRWRVIRNTFDWWKVMAIEHFTCVRFPTKKYTSATHNGSQLEGVTFSKITWAETGVTVGHSDFTGYSILDGIVTTPILNSPVKAQKFFPINNVFN